MLSGVGIICFTASYAVAFFLELSRLIFRSGVRGALMLGFAGAGLLAHSAYLYHEASKAKASPLSSEQAWYLLAAWTLIVVYLYLTYYYPRTAFGLFVLPLALALITASRFADATPYAREPATKIWGTIHATSILLGTVSVLIGFIAGLMYLVQTRRLKHKLPPSRGLKLPSLEWLQRSNARAIVWSVIALGVCVASGTILFHLREQPLPKSSAATLWADPLVSGTALLFAALLTAVALGAVYHPARQGKKVAYLTLLSFAVLVLVLILGLVAGSRHGGGL